MATEKNIVCKVLLADKLSCNGTIFEIAEEDITPDDKLFWIYLGVYIFLMLFAGLMSGLTMGLLSLDLTQLEILEKAGKEREQKFASAILPIVKRHHLMLVTLVLWNAAAVESMPIFMDKITNPVMAVIVSATAVLIFGEIIPQALCTRYGLAIGYYTAPVLKLLMFLIFIFAWPLSKLLDRLLGSSHTTFFRRAELKELVDIHHKFEEDNEEPLSADEVLIIKGALDLKDKVAKDALVPLDAIFMLEKNDKLDLKTMNSIIDAGHSRIPIYDKDRGHIIGILLVKTIITLDPDDCVPVLNVMRFDLPTFFEGQPLYDILNACQTGKSHMCVIKRLCEDQTGNKTVGIITLEDILEEILQEEIVDETDKYIDVAKRIKVARLRRKLSRADIGNRFANSTDWEFLTDGDERTPLLGNSLP